MLGIQNSNPSLKKRDTTNRLLSWFKYKTENKTIFAYKDHQNPNFYPFLFKKGIFEMLYIPEKNFSASNYKPTNHRDSV